MGPDDLSDAELWRLAAGHDGQAFGRLFERHATKIYNHCFRRTADWSLAEDLTSVVFLEAWRRRRQVTLVGDSILPWLLGVANNCLRNAHRSRRRYRRLLIKVPPSTNVPSFEAEASERLDDTMTMAHMLDALGRLPRRDQEIISICDWAGLRNEEAADALGIPIGTVKSRLSRARDRLREALEVPEAGTRTPSEQGGLTK